MADTSILTEKKVSKEVDQTIELKLAQYTLKDVIEMLEQRAKLKGNKGDVITTSIQIEGNRMTLNMTGSKTILTRK